MRRSNAWLIAAGVLLAAGCTGPGDGQPQPIEAGETSDDGSAASTEAPDPQEDPGPSDEDEVEAAWLAFREVFVEQQAAEEPDPDAFAEVAVDPDEWVQVLSSSSVPIVVDEVEHWPTVAEVGGGEATIEDCTIVTSRTAAQDEDDASTETVFLTASLVEQDGRWLVQGQLQRAEECVAQELHDQLIGAYEAYREAKEIWWDPPDPDHPLLEETTTGGELEFFRELLVADREDGIVLRDPAPTDNAEVVRVAVGYGIVQDCVEQVPERGAFDLETGERLDDEISPIQDGQIDLYTVGLARGEDGVWRVEESSLERNADCEPGEDAYVVR